MPIELEPHVLQARVSILTASINERAGGTPDVIRFGESDRLTRERHEDILMVHLGMKPMATFFDPVLDIRRRFGEDYVSRLVKPGIVISPRGDAVWNSEIVEEVLNENEDLLAKSIHLYPELQTKLISPQSPDFVSFVRMVANIDDLKEGIALEGVMLGYPREACETFGTYYPLFGILVGMVKDALEKERRDSILNNSFPFYQLATNEGGLRDELLKVADSLPRRVNPYIVKALQQMRLADVPGTRYFTFGDITALHERKVRDAFSQSGIKQKLGLK